MTPAESGSGRLIAPKFALPVLYIVVLALLAYRMTIGVDLTDELYDVTFLDDWLKDGLGHGENLVVHQTAALLMFPAARLYVWIEAASVGWCYSSALLPGDGGAAKQRSFRWSAWRN